MTDREFALITALPATILTENVDSCSWHIRSNTFAKQRTAFSLEEDFDRFLQNWSSLENTSTEAALEAVLEDMRGYLSCQSMRCVAGTWLIYKVIAHHIYFDT